MSSDCVRKRPPNHRSYTQEDEALDQIAKEAERNISRRKQDRNLARSIRMNELRAQNSDGEDCTNENGGGEEMILCKELAELEDKYKKAMISNSRLDNEKQSYRYQADLLKDEIEEMEETLSERTREWKDRCRQLESTKRELKDCQVDCNMLKEQLKHRDELIEQYGLVFISDDTVENNTKKKNKKKNTEKALVTPEAARLLATGDGTLEDRLMAQSKEKEKLEIELKMVKQKLEEECEKSALAEKYASPKPSVKSNGPDVAILEVQMEAQKQVNDYKFKLKNAEQSITAYQGNIIRLESQVKRYKTAAENSEKLEEELKQEKRKLQKQLREIQSQLEEMETTNQHLQKRLEKLRQSRALPKP